MMKNKFVRIAVLMGIHILFTYLMFFPFGWKKHIESNNLYEWATFGIIGSVIPIILTLIFYKVVDKKSIKEVGFRFNVKDLLFSLSMFILMTSAALGYMFYLSNKGVISANWNFDVFSEPSFYIQLILVGFGWFFAAFNEEILFRGYLVSNLRSFSKGKLYVVISIVFMVSHVFKGLNPIYALVLMVMSLVFVYAYLKSGSIMPITFAHMTWNILSPHLIGKSDISILLIEGQERTLDMFVLLATFLGLLIILTNLFYRKDTGIVINKTIEVK